MKITVELNELYGITLYNNHTSMGCYYHEDDWSLTGYGDTINQAIEYIINNTPEKKLTKLYIDYITMYNCKTICYNNIHYEVEYLDEIKDSKLNYNDIQEMINESKKIKDYKEKIRIKKEKDKQLEQELVKQKELTQLANLKQKYESTN